LVLAYSAGAAARSSDDEFDRWFISKYGELFVNQLNGTEAYRIELGSVFESVVCPPSTEELIPVGDQKRLFSFDLERNEPKLGSYRIEYSSVRLRSLLDCLLGREDDFRKFIR
jgi:hypothetical protein